MIDVAEKIKLGARARDAARPIQSQDRASYLNASEAGTCIRKQWFARAYPDEAADQDWGYAYRGTHGEVYMVDALRAANVELLFGGADQQRIMDDEYMIAGTSDGILIDHEIGALRPLDFKTFDPRTRDDNVLKSYHILQVQIVTQLWVEFRHLFPELEEFADWPIEKPLLVYMNASNFNDIRQFDVDPDPAVLERMRKRAERLFRTKQVTRLPREGKEQGGTECAQRCSFKDRCGVELPEAGEATVSRANEGSRMSALVSEYLSIKGDERDLKTRLEAAKEGIKQELLARKAKTLQVGKHTATLKMMPGRVSYDRKKMEADGAFEKYAKIGNGFEQLEVK